MKKIFLLTLLLGLYANVFSQTYDVNYTIEYALKKADGTEINRLKLFRNGDKLRFQKFSNQGKADSSTTDIYINKNDPKIYMITSNSAGKFGTKSDYDYMYAGMATGIYILDFDKMDANGRSMLRSQIFTPASQSGTGTILGKECTKYTLITQSYGSETASSDYYFFQDNLMLLRHVGTQNDGNNIEALSYDSGIVPESMFTIPVDVLYMN
ncbi:hypothetical protein BH10BAC5_BH10BAC5_03730 [soil metagenome]